MKYNKVPLGDLITVLTDYHANGAYQKLKENVELLDDEDYALMVRTTNFESNDFSDSLKFISEHAYNFLEKSKVYGGDLIMNKIANAGSIYLMPDLKRPVSLAMNLFLIRVDEQKANPVYVYIFLKVNEAYVKQFANGSVTKTITKDAVRNLEISLPPREVQNEIANQYNSLSKKIAVNSRINKTLEEVAQAIFKSWFVDFDPVKAKMNGEQPEGMDDATASLFPEKLVESDLGWVPFGWGVEPLDSIFTVNKGLSYKGKFLSEDKSDVPLINLGNFGGNGKFRYEKVKYYSGDYKPRHVVKAGQLVIANTDMTQDRVILGSAILVPELGAEEYLTTHHTFSTSFKKQYPEDVWKYFVFYSLQRPSFRFRAEGFATGTTVLAMPKDAFTFCTVALPPVELVERFSALVQSLKQKIACNEKENVELTNLRDTLLPKLLSGEIELETTEELVEVN